MLIPGLELANMISEKDARLLCAWLQMKGSSSCSTAFINAVWRNPFTGLGKLMYINPLLFQILQTCNYT
jgi:hypothetical protein